MRAEHKRPPLLKTSQWIILIVLMLIVLIMLINVTYTSLQKPIWQEQNSMSSEIAARSDLEKVTAVQKSVWDTLVWVAQGINHEGKEAYVFYADGKVTHEILAADCQSEGSIKQRLFTDQPNASITHIKPGILNDQPVWECFYSVKNQQQYGYRFYDFQSGNLISSFNVPSSYAS